MNEREELFYRTKELADQVERLNAIVQNEMEIGDKEIIEFDKSFQISLSNLLNWKNQTDKFIKNERGN